MEFSYHLSQLPAAARWLLQQAGQRRIIALFAPMGAGKTTLSGAILHALGSTDHAASPTFSLINEYALPDGSTLYHMDWYRLKDEEEAMAAGIEDALYSGHRCLVEWPERAPALLPPDALRVEILATDPETRLLKVAAAH
ncbi:MAG: tRNA (adenosine(37)-N6)-threonylcarbamoyltransferase complex ATPase subunit type 1 TsaE [Chitinophagaceae bacterium]|jgi:tRNA threonylcarbamoyladenosine biosynthesis protein TsaE|nr:tRNA (adenosine(37)-N6)-threonylcarbamoyltransferase complex ATPase subunit type 1 TsaE [Chitinophagaceae bacterium]